MKLKYYLRGLGIGIIITTLILMISFSMRKDRISDEDVIERALLLGMIMPEEDVSDMVPDTFDVLETEQQTENGVLDETKDYPADGEEHDNLGTEEMEAQSSETLEDGQIQDNSANVFRLQIQKGDVARNVCENLAANGVVDDAEAFRTYLSQIGYASFMSVGDYDIPYNITYEEIAQILKAGPLEQP